MKPKKQDRSRSDDCFWCVWNSCWPTACFVPAVWQDRLGSGRSRFGRLYAEERSVKIRTKNVMTRVIRVAEGQAYRNAFALPFLE